MANPIKIKRSAVAGKVPATGDLQLGEMAINTLDGRLYSKKNVSAADSIIEFLSTDGAFKAIVNVATTANITLSGTQTIDGIAVVAGDRVLVKNQSTTAENGVYVVAAGAWGRSHDTDTATELAGALVPVRYGSASGGKIFKSDFLWTDALGTDPLVFTEFGVGSGGGATSSTTAPGSPADNALWWNSEEGALKIYYNDGTSSQWVDAAPAGTPGVDGADGVDAAIGGTDTFVQFNDGGVFGGVSSFTFNKTTNVLQLSSVDAGTAAGPIIDLYRDSASPANFDNIGLIRFSGENASGAKVNYVVVGAKARSVTAGAETGELYIHTDPNNTNRYISIYGDVFYNGGDNPYIGYESNADNANGTYLEHWKTRAGGVPVDNDVVNSQVYGIATQAAGAQWNAIAKIACVVDGTPSSTSAPGALIFSTVAVGSLTMSERFRISNFGGLGIGGENYGTAGHYFRSGGGAAAPSWSAIAQSEVTDLVAELALLRTVPANAQTGTTYTLVLTDAGKAVRLSNAAAITLTIPTNASVAFPVDTRIDLIQMGAGQVTIGGSVTIRSSGSKLKIAGQYSGATLLKIATDEWVLIGDIAA